MVLLMFSHLSILLFSIDVLELLFLFSNPKLLLCRVKLVLMLFFPPMLLFCLGG